MNPDLTPSDDFDDETTSFADGPVDGLVFLPSTDNPELRMRPAQPTAPSHSYHPVTPRRSARPGPTAPWTPGPPVEPESTPRDRSWTAPRIAVTVFLAVLPIAAGLWLVRLGLTLSGH